MYARIYLIESHCGLLWVRAAETHIDAFWTSHHFDASDLAKQRQGAFQLFRKLLLAEIEGNIPVLDHVLNLVPQSKE